MELPLHKNLDFFSWYRKIFWSGINLSETYLQWVDTSLHIIYNIIYNILCFSQNDLKTTSIDKYLTECINGKNDKWSL